MTSQSCQRGRESARRSYRGPCHTAVCSQASSLRGRNLEPPNKYGGQSKLVQSSTVGSSWVAECQAGLLRMLLLSLLLWCMPMAASPATKLFVKPATERNGEDQHIICKLDGFYPEAFDLKWEKSTLNDPNFRVITEGVITGPTVRNDDGTFSVISSLALKPALEGHGNTYSCVVSHRSFLGSKRLSVTLPEKRLMEIYVTIVSPCILLALVIVFRLWSCLI